MALVTQLPKLQEDVRVAALTGRNTAQYLNERASALAGATLHAPGHGFSPHQGTYPGCGHDYQLGFRKETTD